MGRKLELWRAADRAAHDAEMQIRCFGKHREFMGSDGALEQARELRRRADHLFGEAMHEIGAEVGRALREG